MVLLSPLKSSSRGVEEVCGVAVSNNLSLWRMPYLIIYHCGECRSEGTEMSFKDLAKDICLECVYVHVCVCVCVCFMCFQTIGFCYSALLSRHNFATLNF